MLFGGKDKTRNVASISSGAEFRKYELGISSLIVFERKGYDYIIIIENSE